MKMRRELVTALVFICSLQFYMTEGSGQIKVHLIKYVNPGGRLNNTDRCDPADDCDHMFLVCVDDRNGSSNVNKCKYGNIQTGSINGENTNNFGSSIGGTPNPLTFRFSESWPRFAKIKIKIKDEDNFYSKDDFVEQLSAVVDIATGAREKEINIAGRTNITIGVKVFCDPNFFTASCNVRCAPDDKYTCNTETGKKICKQGWQGESCQTSVDDCPSSTSQPCMNGGTCVDGHLTYTCACPNGYTGKKCEVDVDECLSSPCRNQGSCANTKGGFLCQCPPGRTGQLCTEYVDLCRENPCNNSMCESLLTGYRCMCGAGWTGTQCEIDMNACRENPCNNFPCEPIVTGYRCMCGEGWAGKQCEIDMNACRENPCNNFPCEPIVTGYRCTCGEGWTGTQCGTDMNSGSAIVLLCRYFLGIVIANVFTYFNNDILGI